MNYIGGKNMHRILIVDDEKDERSVIRFLLNKYNFELDIAEAANGKEAISQLRNQSVDILFTDVKMPFINGIELAAKARELHPDIQIIFFSGHDDFDFVKKALSLRAVDYILKPVKPLEFKNTILSVIQNIKTQEKEQIQKKVNTSFLKTHILYRLINKTPLDILKNEYPFIDFDFLNEYYQLILIQFEEPFFDTLSKEEDTLFFYEQIKKIIPSTCDFIDLNPFQILILLKNDTNYLEPPMQIASKIQKKIYSVYGIQCYMSVSKEISTSSEIPIIYEKLEKYLEDRFFYSETYIYPIDTSITQETEWLEHDEHLLHAIQEAIQYVDTFSLKQNINILFQKYYQKKEISHIYVRYLFSRLLQLLCQVLKEYDEKTVNEKMSAIYSCKYFSEIENILLTIQEEVLKKLEKKEQSPKHVIHIVQQYITEHYGEDLSLNILAEKAYLSPRYLSEVFIQETGCGLNKYIKNFRMEKAKKLLHNTNMKINDICKEVGYQNFSYFCRSFRENFGTSPEKFRQMYGEKKKEND